MKGISNMKRTMIEDASLDTLNLYDTTISILLKCGIKKLSDINSSHLQTLKFEINDKERFSLVSEILLLNQSDLNRNIEGLDIQLYNVESSRIAEVLINFKGTEEETIQMTRILYSKLGASFSTELFKYYDEKIAFLYDFLIRNSDYEKDISNNRYIGFLIDGFCYHSKTNFYMMRYLFQRFKDFRIKEDYYNHLMTDKGDDFDYLIQGLFDPSFDFNSSQIRGEFLSAYESKDYEGMFDIALKNQEKFKNFSQLEAQEILSEITKYIDSENYAAMYGLKVLLDAGINVNTRIQDNPLIQNVFHYNDYSDYANQHDDFIADGGYGYLTSAQNIIFSYHPNLDIWIEVKSKKIPFLEMTHKNFSKYSSYPLKYVHKNLGDNDGELFYRGLEIMVQGYVSVVKMKHQNKIYFALSMGALLEKDKSYDFIIHEKTHKNVKVLSNVEIITVYDYVTQFDDVDYEGFIYIASTENKIDYDKIDPIKIEEDSTVNEKLIQATKKNDVESMKKYIDSGSDINAGSKFYAENVSLLSIAIVKDNKEAFDFLLNQKGIDMFHLDEFGNSCFSDAIRSCQVHYIDSFISKGFSFEDTYKTYRSIKESKYKELLEISCPHLYYDYTKEHIIQTEEQLKLAMFKNNSIKVNYLIKDIKINQDRTYYELLKTHNTYDLNNFATFIENNQTFIKKHLTHTLLVCINSNDLDAIKKIPLEWIDLNNHYSITEIYDLYIYNNKEYEEDKLSIFQYAVYSGNQGVIDYFYTLGGKYEIENKMKRNALFYCKDMHQAIKMIDVCISRSYDINKVHFIEKLSSDDAMRSDNDQELRKKYKMIHYFIDQGLDIYQYLKTDFFYYARVSNLIDIYMLYDIEPYKKFVHLEMSNRLNESYISERDIKFLEKLIKSGFDITYNFEKEKSVYKTLTSKKKNKIIEEFLKNYINKDVRNEEGLKTFKIVKVFVLEKNSTLTYECSNFKLSVDDTVEIPYGRNNEILLGTVVESIQTLNEYELEFSPNKLKSIIRKV
jgi:hypothetical protein